MGLSNYELSVSYRQLCSVMHQLRNSKVNEKRLSVMVNYFSLKRSNETITLLHA
jgi:hypothetical protein